MTPINCVSKSRSFSSDLLNVAMNSHGWLFCQDKGKEESSATSLTHQILKLIISVAALFRRVSILS